LIFYIKQDRKIIKSKSNNKKERKRPMNNADLSKASKLSKTSLILGICSIIPVAGWPIGLAAIIVGIVDLVKISKNEAGKPGKKFDITGIILGVIFPQIYAVIMVAIYGAAYFTMIGASVLGAGPLQ
jgi:hypothetical protein